MNRAELTGVLALSAVLLGGTAPCGAMVVQEAPAGAPDSDGDGIPDALDPYPLIADFKLLTWYVSAIQVGWSVKTEGAVKESQTWTWDRSQAEVKTEGWKQSVRGDVEIGAEVKTRSELSSNPLKAFGLFDAKANLDIRAKAGLSYSGEMDWSAARKIESRQAFESARTLVSETRFGDPYMAVWITFCNHSPGDLTLTTQPLPIFCGGKPITEAKHGEGGQLVLPAMRPEGIPERFEAKLDTTVALQLLKDLQDGGPTAALERSRMTVRDAAGQDAVSAARKIHNSTTEIRVTAGELSYSWRVACTDQVRRQPMTVRQALEAISARLGSGLGMGQLFMFKGDSLQKIAETDVASNEGQWFVSSGGGADQAIDAAILSRKLCTGGDLHFGFKSRDQLVAEDLELAVTLLERRSVDDDSRAVELLRTHAIQKESRAQFLFGLCHLNGRGVTANKVEAVKWFRKAAEQRNARGQLLLGVCYEQGEGVPRDQAEAVKWYQLAAAQGNEEAAGLLQIVQDKEARAKQIQGLKDAALTHFVIKVLWPF